MKQTAIVAVAMVLLLLFGCSGQLAKLSPDECFYNSKTEELSCGRNFAVVHKGVSYNISTTPTKIDVCGMVGFVGEKTDKSKQYDTSDSYLAYIVKDTDVRFTLSEELSQRAVGSLMSDDRCK